MSFPMTAGQKRQEAKAIVAVIGLCMMIAGSIEAFGIGGGLAATGLWLSLAVMSDFRAE